MRFGLSDAIMESFRAIFSATPALEKVLLFGSRARGEGAASSDIDLAVVAPMMTVEEFTGLWQRLDDLPLVYKIDLVRMEQLQDEALKAMIVRDGREIYP